MRPIATALAASLAVGLAGSCFAQSPPLLLQQPTISRSTIVFTFAGDLWSVPRAGGDAVRLTTGPGEKTHAHFSPDGAWIAFTAQYDGSQGEYVMPAAGGVPRRLTYSPDDGYVVGWSPDSRRVLFTSTRSSFCPVSRLFTVSRDGGYPAELPFPTGTAASYSADGKRIAYVPVEQWQRAWKRYRGGQTTPIWLTDVGTLRIEKVPRSNTNDFDPMWIGASVYFLSDRSGPVSLFRYDTATRRVSQVVKNEGLDFKSASAGPGAIVYEQFGSLHVLDLATDKESRVAVRIAADLPEVRQKYIDVSDRIRNASISPTGVRAAFEARGEIFTVPLEKGQARDITNTPGAMERDPSWSPDGKRIAYFSDESGEYVLHLRDQSGTGEVRKIPLSDHPTFFYRPTWSPDSKKIAYYDKRLTLWCVDVDGGQPVKVDTTPYYTPGFSFDQSWSPDSRWITYRKELLSHIDAVCVYSVDSHTVSQITDGMSDARSPAFDKDGKYLYFTASTDVGLIPGWLNMTSMAHPVTRSVYVAVLRKDLPSPLAPESDEEKAAETGAVDKHDAGAPAAKAPERVTIDFDGIGQRILALPIPSRDYIGLAAGKAGSIFLLEGPAVYDLSLAFGGGSGTLHRFDLAKRKVEKLLDGVSQFSVSANGEKLLYRAGRRWAITSASGSVDATAGTLSLDGMECLCDPRAEWRQMYHEVWRLERDFFYDPGHHGLDIAAAEHKYAPFVEGLASREDLNYLFEEMLGELTCGHVFVGGGDTPEVKTVPVGLLGADYTVENGRYRFSRVYNGENWNPDLRAPLTQPGVNVKAGEYLLAVDGVNVTTAQDVYGYFQARADKQVTIRVGPSPDGTGSRDVVVVPVKSEYGLRNLAWIEDNRRKVDQMSGGRLAYVYLPDTAEGGYANFNRYYFAQVGKDGVIVDERFNGGGLIADYIIDYLRRPLQGYFTSRDGQGFRTPASSIYGPKAMIIDEYAGSGGDMMPWLFRDAHVGPLVGKRTWGGLVGMNGAAVLMDGGSAGAPQSGFWNPNGTWDVENHGVDPDIEVEMDPAAVRAGHDPQLERAVAVVMDELTKHPLPVHKKPIYPDYQGHDPKRRADMGTRL